ncbi:MAG: class II aldolase/adducin family protein [Thermoplasmata archaeon]|nr:class II aldolase/adducin family protein [Thermoplasmata archaeon]
MEVIYLATEEVKNPLLEEMKEVGRRLKEKGYVTETYGNISVRYGKRMIITASNSDLGNLGNDDFVEVVDYNPVTNVAMVIGTKKPSRETPMHWLLYSRDDINAIIHTHKIFDGAPTTEEEKPAGSLELAFEALKTIGSNKLINLKNHGSIAVGSTLREAMEVIDC